MVIYLGLYRPAASSLQRLLSTSGRLHEQWTFATDSEIAAGRIALFTPLVRFSSLLLSYPEGYANLDCQGDESPCSGFHRTPRSLQPGLSSGELAASDHPSFYHFNVLGAEGETRTRTSATPTTP